MCSDSRCTYIGMAGDPVFAVMLDSGARRRIDNKKSRPCVVMGSDKSREDRPAAGARFPCRL